MKLYLPKKYTFWASVIIAAVGVIVFVVHPFLTIPYLGVGGFALVVAAFVLMILGLTMQPL
jgi:hypothetical protein